MEQKETISKVRKKSQKLKVISVNFHFNLAAITWPLISEKLFKTMEMIEPAKAHAIQRKFFFFLSF